MPDRNLSNPTGDEDQNKDIPSEGTEERFLSDTQKIVHRHLENKNDVITEDDIRNVRVGMTPTQMDEATEARFEGDDKIDEIEDELIGEEKQDETEEKTTTKKRITPWDTIEPED